MNKIDQIREICKTPSVFFGRGSVDYRNQEQTLKPDSNTMYMINSCSNMFTSVALVQKHLTELDPKGDTRIGQTARIIDLLRHSSGAPDRSRRVGPRGLILYNKDIRPLLNATPTRNEKGQRFNREWDYNNLTYGLVAMIIKRVSSWRFADFMQERLLNPLGLSRAAVKSGAVPQLYARLVHSSRVYRAA
ncbi:beta-lactamase/transpeptidase-like protein [Aspergillus germanicus]